MEFGVLLSRRKRAMGLTQEQLAERATLSVSAISTGLCGHQEHEMRRQDG
jgi:transcriptional regulator with XRE-family HTH domain